MNIQIMPQSFGSNGIKCLLVEKADVYSFFKYETMNLIYISDHTTSSICQFTPYSSQLLFHTMGSRKNGKVLGP